MYIGSLVTPSQEEIHNRKNTFTFCLDIKQNTSINNSYIEKINLRAYLVLTCFGAAQIQTTKSAKQCLLNACPIPFCLP